MRKSRPSWIAALWLLVVSYQGPDVGAQSCVTSGEDVPDSGVWTTAGSPYCPEPGFVTSPTDPLTIQPNVIVIIDQSMSVGSTLNASGAIFRGIGASLEFNSPAGGSVTNSDLTEIDLFAHSSTFTMIGGSLGRLHLSNTGAPAITNVSFPVSLRPLRVHNGADLTGVTGSIFLPGSRGEVLGQIGGNTTWPILGELKQYQVSADVNILPGATLTIPSGVRLFLNEPATSVGVMGSMTFSPGSSIVFDEDDVAILVEGTLNATDAEFLAVTDGDQRIRFFPGSSGTIIDSSIVSLDEGGQSFEIVLQVESTAVTMTDNLLFAVRVEATGDAPDLYHMEKNCWGTSDYSEIDSRITDFFDDPVFGTIDYLPVHCPIHVLTVGVNEAMSPTNVMNGIGSATKVAEAFKRNFKRAFVHEVVGLDFLLPGCSNWSTMVSKIAEVQEMVEADDLFFFYLHTHGLPGLTGDESPVVMANPLFADIGVPPGTIATGDESLKMSDSCSGTDDDFAGLFAKPAWDGVHKLFALDVCFSGGYWDGDAGDIKDRLLRSALIASAPENNVSYGDVFGVVGGGVGYLAHALGGWLPGNGAIDAIAGPDQGPVDFGKRLFLEVLAREATLADFVVQQNGTFDGIISTPVDMSPLWGVVYLAEFDPIYETNEPSALGRLPTDDSAGLQPLLIDIDAAGDLLLSWDSTCLSAAGEDFGIYEGLLTDFTSHVSVQCSSDGMTSAEITPGSGDRYYLVVPNDGAREGSYGLDGPGSERPWSTEACLPQTFNVGCIQP